MSDQNEIRHPMKKNPDGTYTVVLGQTYQSPFSGSKYSPGTMEEAVKRLQKRGMLRCEYGVPPIERSLLVAEDQVCAAIDTSTIRIEGESVIAKIKPAGPFASALERMLEQSPVHFGMRALVKYEKGHTTQPLKGQKIEHLDIVTFDLIAPPHEK